MSNKYNKSVTVSIVESFVKGLKKGFDKGFNYEYDEITKTFKKKENVKRKESHHE